MVDQARDRVGGKLDETTGKGKSTLGDLTGDERTQAEGEVDQAQGQGEQGLADLKDKAQDAVEKVSGNQQR
jgi:uncharacterized protein YjbJ (UPF0337 family)